MYEGIKTTIKKMTFKVELMYNKTKETSCRKMLQSSRRARLSMVNFWASIYFRLL